MKMKYTRKFIIGTTALAFTAATLVTTTYAWVVVSNVSELREFEFTAEKAHGLQVSLDGITYSQDLTLAQLKNVIASNRGEVYETKYNPVTLKQDTNGNVVFDTNGNPCFVSDGTENLVTTENGVTTDNRSAYEKENSIYYKHVLNDAKSSDYIMFDVWFRIQNEGLDNKSYDLFFEETKEDNGKNVGIFGQSTEVKLNARMTTTTASYNSGQIVTVNPKDAMRLGVVNHTTNAFTVYEESIGLGSMAIEGATDVNHNPNKNAMYTYYNALYSRRKFQSAAKGYETVTSDEGTTNCYTKNAVHTFTYDTTNNEYQDVKLTFAIWLEGWDADYFAGIETNSLFDPSNLKINLGFIAKERN